MKSRSRSQCAGRLPRTTLLNIGACRNRSPPESLNSAPRAFRPQISIMAGKVLIVDIHAELYRDRLLAEFPGLQFMLFHKAAEVSADLSAIDIMIMFGIEIRDRMLRDAPRLQWIQSLATGVDHFLRRPSLRKDVLITSGRGIHGVPMREH